MAEAFLKVSTIPSRASIEDYRIAIRVGVVAIALAILFWRTPLSFTHPQFWGEDIFFYDDALIMGWQSVGRRLAGYLTVAQYLIGVLSSPFDPVIVPAIFCYAAILLTLLVVWLITSPRLDLPLKPLLAIAVVIVRMGGEELGTTCNIQWILPIGAFAMLFMRASRSIFVLCAEAMYLALTAFSGPFSVFLAPMFVWQTWRATSTAERNRMALLTTIAAIAGVVQAICLLDGQPDVPAQPYPWTLWITLPLIKILTTFNVASHHFEGLSGAAIGAFALSMAVALASLRPYRTQKVFMLIFSLLIMFGGLFKFHHDLAGQTGAQRYFYVASVFCALVYLLLDRASRISTMVGVFHRDFRTDPAASDQGQIIYQSRLRMARLGPTRLKRHSIHRSNLASRFLLCVSCRA
jgi:MFS family permease